MMSSIICVSMDQVQRSLPGSPVTKSVSFIFSTLLVHGICCSLLELQHCSCSEINFFMKLKVVDKTINAEQFL